MIQDNMLEKLRTEIDQLKAEQHPLYLEEACGNLSLENHNLRAENQRLREALEFVVDDGVSCPWETRERVARAALEVGK